MFKDVRKPINIVHGIFTLDEQDLQNIVHNIKILHEQEPLNIVHVIKISTTLFIASIP